MAEREVRLGVNIDHIASVRQLRRGTLPDPAAAARVCERAGAASIVCHLREDRRHINDDDVKRLRRAVRTRLNLEMSIAPDVVSAALRIRPDQVTLVPERRRELTTEGGLDAAGMFQRLDPLVETFLRRGIEVSLFIDPVERQIQASAALGVPTVELHTGAYAGAAGPARRRRLADLRRAVASARAAGLAVAAGHGLDYRNTPAVAAIEEIFELNIGYSIIVRSLETGLHAAVSEMVKTIRRGAAHARA